ELQIKHHGLSAWVIEIVVTAEGGGGASKTGFRIHSFVLREKQKVSAAYAQFQIVEGPVMIAHVQRDAVAQAHGTKAYPRTILNGVFHGIVTCISYEGLVIISGRYRRLIGLPFEWRAGSVNTVYQVGMLPIG